MYKGMFYQPWRDLRNLKKDIHRVVNDFLGSEPQWEGGYWQPAVDMVETDDAFIVAAELPGMQKEAIKINIHENKLNLSGERKPFRQEKNTFHSEFWHGPFSRTVQIPDEINQEKVVAKYENGILLVTLPRQKKTKTKEVKIEVN